MEIDWNQVLIVCCVAPAILLFIVGFVIVRNFRRFIRRFTEFSAPDADALHQQFAQMQAANPSATQQQLIQRIINQYAFRQGVVGAITSVGGFIVLPFGLTLDMLHSARSNAALSYFIAQTYGIDDVNKSLNFSQLLALRRGKVSFNDVIMWQDQLTGVVYQQFMQWILRKSFAKVIPGLGAIIGFIVNYSSAQVFGRIAQQYYSGNAAKLLERGTQGLQSLSARADADPPV